MSTFPARLTAISQSTQSPAVAAEERRLCALWATGVQHEDDWSHRRASPGFPLAEWEELIRTGNEGIVLAALNAGSSSKGHLLGSGMYAAYVEHETGATDK